MLCSAMNAGTLSQFWQELHPLDANELVIWQQIMYDSFIEFVIFSYDNITA